MPNLIRLADGAFRADPGAGRDGGGIVSFAELREAGGGGASGAVAGVRLAPDEAVEDLVPFLPRLGIVALEFPKFRDGRAFSTAMLLRRRYGWRGELRAVGDVLREQALEMVRCGFDAFEPADGSAPEDFARAVLRYRHVYQAGADERAPAHRLREMRRAA